MKIPARYLPFLAGLWTTTALAAAPPPQPSTYALLINGGASAPLNYLSHLHHLQDMTAELKSRGIQADHIDIFSGDGEDPRPDLAVREAEPKDWWLIDGTVPGRALKQPDLTNTVWEGVKLRPARLKDLRQWFARMGKTLRPGDTLFVFVTDHGNKDNDDPDNGLINLWNESLSLLQYRALLAHLKPGVRVVNVMSQCYSGAFAEAMAPLNSTVPTGDVCGFYSVPRDRPAYGCYPEGRDRDRLGHAFRFIDAMGRHAAFDDAHDAVLLLDTSPDVPIRTSDLYLEHLLAAEAEKRGVSLDAFVDEKLAEAWRNRGHWEPEIRLMDRIGEVYGFPSPRLLSELKPRVTALESLSTELDTYGDRWKMSLDDLRKDNLEKFVDNDPTWKPQLEPGAIAALKADQKAEVVTELLTALAGFTAGRPEVQKRLDDLRTTYGEARDAQYVVDVRLAALLRMRALLIRVAGVRFLDGGGPSPDVDGDEPPVDWRRALDGLTRCEGTALGKFDPSHETAVLKESPDALPPLDADLAAVQRALPSWLGVGFLPLTDSQRERFSVEHGAVFVQRIFAGGPAEVAGLKVGDVLVGPPARHFAEANQIREWTMTSPRGTPLALDIVRDGRPAQVTVTLIPFPDQFPAIPPPPKEGDTAPKLGALRMVRPENENLEAIESGRHMLFFWATWCAPCKASIPQLLAWSERSHVPVLAISDEDPDTISKFLGTWKDPFPENVASDELRQAYIGYAVSGTPTFVFIDAEGKILWRHTGFSPKDGLAVP